MKVTTTKALVAFGAIAATTLGLTGCAAEAPAEPVTLTVWADQFYIDALTEQAAAYTEETNVTIKFVDTTGKDVRADFLQQVADGKGPDITIGAHDWVGELVANGAVSPLEYGDKLGDFLPVAQQAVQYDGKAYALPFAVESIALLRNADLVAEAPTSWDDMVADGFVVQQGEGGDPYHLYPIQTSFGAAVFGLDAQGGFDPAQLSLDNEGGLEFAQFLADNGANGTGTFSVAETYDTAKEKFLAGDAAYWLTGPWSVAGVKEAGVNVAIDVVPSAGGEASAPFAGVKTFFLSSASANQVAATDFLVNFLGSTSVQEALYAANGILPANAAAAETASSDPIVAGFAAVGAQAVPMPAIPAMASVWAEWAKAEVGLIGGTATDAAATWTAMAEAIRAAIAG